MAKRFKRAQEAKGSEVNLTPMIDVVFQLIVFLMLASDISNTEMERVYLPKADAAIADERPDKTRLMVNISHVVPMGRDCPELRYKNGILISPCQIEEHWKIVVKTKQLTIPELEQLLIVEGNLDRETKGNPKTPSNRPIMIRCDGSAPFLLITKILEAAGKAFVWKIEIGAEKPPVE
ncbi:MAG: biopolymer transporter ExbD [Planctomycetota bacterium]